METFIATKIDGKEVELTFKDADAATLTEASRVYNKTFAELLESGGMLRKKLAATLKAQGLWSDEQQEELEAIQKQIVEKEHRLHLGGMKATEGRDLALEISADRAKQAALLSSYNEYDNVTVEGQADNARFNYLVYCATVYSKNKKRYFASFDDFVSYKDPVAFVAASKYAKEYYNLDEDFESSLPENQFLKKFKFVDEDLRFVNSDGKLVDRDGNLVNEDGQRVDENGNLLDLYGYKRTEDGGFAEEAQPFLDDDGKPVAVDSDAVEATVEDSA